MECQSASLVWMINSSCKMNPKLLPIPSRIKVHTFMNIFSLSYITFILCFYYFLYFINRMYMNSQIKRPHITRAHVLQKLFLILMRPFNYETSLHLINCFDISKKAHKLWKQTSNVFLFFFVWDPWDQRKRLSKN